MWFLSIRRVLLEELYEFMRESVEKLAVYQGEKCCK